MTVTQPKHVLSPNIVVDPYRCLSSSLDAMLSLLKASKIRLRIFLSNFGWICVVNL